MNFEYIEQLLNRYWQCDTTLEEEQILRSFFSQPDIPLHLKQYAPLFQYQHEESLVKLSDNFESRVLTSLEDNTDVSTRKSIWQSLINNVSPLFKAAASIALIITIGNATEHVVQRQAVSQPEMSNTYVRQENISARIKVIDETKSATIAQVDSVVAGQQDYQPTLQQNNEIIR